MSSTSDFPQLSSAGRVGLRTALLGFELCLLTAVNAWANNATSLSPRFSSTLDDKVIMRIQGDKILRALIRKQSLRADD